MNGNGSKIEIFKPFGESFELMKKILFQPFDLRKWLVIGFAAWLANLGGGGGGVGNFNYPDNRREGAQKLNETIGQIPQPILITGICILVCLIFFLIVLVAWLRARGRPACAPSIPIPRGTSSTTSPPVGSASSTPRSSPISAMRPPTCWSTPPTGTPPRSAASSIPWGDQGQPGVAFWIGLSLFVFVAVCLAFVWALASQLMVPIMYRQRCPARLAFAQAVDLVTSHPGPILLYVLFLLLLGVAVFMISCAVTCATCCIAAIPYVGTVILLPIPVTLGAFSLLFLRQFGPDYDVWAGFVPPEFLPVLIPTPASPGTEAS